MVGYTKSGLRYLTVELLTTTLIGAALLGPAAAQVSTPGSAPDGRDAAAKTEQTEDLRTILPLLLTSPDRKRLAVELEAAMRAGDSKKAENSLNAAIEVGTLAIVLIDHLNDPGLGSALRSLGIRNDGEPDPVPPAAERETVGACVVPPVTPMPNLADMQQALEQERAYSGRVSQTLASFTQERDALTERVEKATKSQALASSEMQQALQRERDRSQAAIGEMERLREEYRTLQAAREKDKAAEASNASERDTLLAQERERSEKAERQLAGMEKELRDLRALKNERMASATARVAELEKALALAQRRSDMLTRELVDTDEELRSLQAPRRPSATPVVFRLAATGTELPLAPLQEEAPVPSIQAKTAIVVSGKALPDATSALPRDLAPVVVASLPDGIQPLPLGTTVAPPKAEPSPETGPGLGTPAEAPKPDDRLTIRAEELFHKGDVSGARLLFERAMDGGHARAAFLLAETFDPNVLSKLGVLGIRGDAVKARELYARARAMGSAQAGERLEALK